MLQKMRSAWLLLVFLVGGCLPTGNNALPTTSSIEMALTAEVLTQNAPPPGFEEVEFAPIDRQLERLPHWHYIVSLSFEGVIADTRKTTTGTISAEVFSNELVGERRVVIRAFGDAFAGDTTRNVEGVRLANKFYFVDQNGTCSEVTEDPNRRRVAELTAGGLIGGIRAAKHTPTRRQVGDLTVYQYLFLPGDVDPPGMEMTQGGGVTIASGELWVAPSLGVVRDYALTLEIRTVIIPIIKGNEQLTGTVRASYQLVEVNTPYNIAIPFGC